MQHHTRGRPLQRAQASLSEKGARNHVINRSPRPAILERKHRFDIKRERLPTILEDEEVPKRITLRLIHIPAARRPTPLQPKPIQTRLKLRINEPSGIKLKIPGRRLTPGLKLRFSIPKEHRINKKPQLRLKVNQSDRFSEAFTDELLDRLTSRFPKKWGDFGHQDFPSKKSFLSQPCTLEDWSISYQWTSTAIHRSTTTIDFNTFLATQQRRHHPH